MLVQALCFYCEISIVDADILFIQFIALKKEFGAKEGQGRRLFIFLYLE